MMYGRVGGHNTGHQASRTPCRDSADAGEDLELSTDAGFAYSSRQVLDEG
jgi:hypothetical protein